MASEQEWQHLFNAIERGQNAVVEQQLKKLGHDVYQADILHLAVKAGHRDIVALFVEKHNFNVVSQDVEVGTYPISYTSTNSDSSCFDYLVKKGADLSCIDRQGATPLHWALDNACSWMTKKLINAGVDLSPLAKHNITPLHMAARRDNPESVEMLLKAGAPVDPLSVTAQTPLHIAVKSGKESITKVLLKYGADLNLKVKEKTPLLLALENNQKAIATLLLNCGADPDILCGGKSLQEAVAEKQNAEEIIEFLNHWKEAKTPRTVLSTHPYTEEIFGSDSATGDLFFNESAVISNSVKHDGEWWNGQTGGSKGTFPGNFVVSTVLCLAKAKYFFNANRSDELSFKRDDIIQVYEKKDNGWWRGIILDTDQGGLFPANHVQALIEAAKAVVAPTPRYQPPKPKETTPIQVASPVIMAPPTAPASLNIPLNPIAISNPITNPSILPPSGVPGGNPQPTSTGVKIPRVKVATAGAGMGAAVNASNNPGPHAFVSAKPKALEDTRPRARVLYPYEPQHDGDLQLMAGAVIILVNQPEGGWWEGEFNGARGIFPSNYVELI